MSAWPEQPFALITTTSHGNIAPSLPDAHHAVRVARLMALTHNTIFRAFNAVHTQVAAVDPSNATDTADLLAFLTFTIAFLDNHHQCEELVFFPMVEAQAGIPGLMSQNVEQHRAFDATLDSLRDYITQVQSGEALLDAGVLRSRIEALAVPLGQHLRDEIPSLLALGADGCLSEEAIRLCYKALHDEAEGTTDGFQYVFLLGGRLLRCPHKAGEFV
jgi:hemerythrin-like domain-containing protein